MFRRCGSRFWKKYEYKWFIWMEILGNSARNVSEARFRKRWKWIQRCVLQATRAQSCWEMLGGCMEHISGMETPLTPTVSGCAYYQSSSFLYFNLPWCSIIMTSNQKKSSGNMSWEFAGVFGSLYSLIDAQKDKHMTLTNTIHSALIFIWR